MNREVHVRFWESPEVKVLRATRQSRRPDGAPDISGLPPINGHYQTGLLVRLVSKNETARAVGAAAWGAGVPAMDGGWERVA